MCLVKLPDELNIFSQYLHLKGFLSSVRSFFFLFFFFFFFFFSFFFFFFFWAAQGGGCNPPNPPLDPPLPWLIKYFSALCISELPAQPLVFGPTHFKNDLLVYNDQMMVVLGLHIFYGQLFIFRSLAFIAYNGTECASFARWPTYHRYMLTYALDKIVTTKVIVDLYSVFVQRTIVM